MKDWGMTVFCIAIFVIAIVSHTEGKGRDGFDNRSMTYFNENEGKTNTSGSAFASAFANEKIRNTFMRDIVKDEMLKVAKVASPSEEKGVFVVKNSSVHFEGMKIECSKNAYTLNVNGRSLIELFCCEIGGMDLSKKPFGVGSGKAIMENVSMIPTRDFGCLKAPLMEGKEYLEFVLRESGFVDAIIGMKESSLLCGGSFVRVSVMECNFKNITRGRAENGKQEELKLFAETCEVSGSYFVDCFQPYYGTVVAPSKISFSCKNTSYVGCANSAVEEKNQTFNERKVFAEGDIKITDCFFKCTSPTDSGGALAIFGESTTCELLRCWFNECSSGNENQDDTCQGGCAHLRYLLKAYIFDINATNSNCSYVCGGIQVRNLTDCQIKSCCFINCSAQYYSLLSICEHKSGTVSSCIIKNGNASVNAGGLNYWSGYGTATISDCAIGNCCANNYGALSFCWNNGTPIGACITFLFFSGNSLNVENAGADISTHDIWIGIIKDEDVKYCYSTSTNLRATDGEVNKTEWLPNPPTASDSFAELYVSWRRGEDTVGWGDHARPFKTVKHALSVRERRKITVVEGEYREMSVNVGECTMVFDGDRRDNSKVISERVMAGSGLFEVTSGELRMGKFSVIHNSSSSAGSSVVKMTGKGVVEAKECVFQSESEAQANPFQVGFVEVSDGVAKFADCLFANIELRSTAMVVCGSVGNVEFVRTEFDRVVRDEGNGSVMDVRVGDGECLEVMEWKLVGCVCRDGNGGGLMVKLQPGGSVMVGNSSAKTTTTEFGKCRAEKREKERGIGGGMMIDCAGGGRDFMFAMVKMWENEGVHGKNVFVVGAELRGMCEKERFGFAVDEENLEEVMGFEAREIGAAVPIVLFWRTFPTTVVVSGRAGVDHVMCGFGVAPCSTMEYAKATHFRSSVRRMQLEQPYEFEGGMVFEGYGYEVSVKSKGTQIRVAGGGAAQECGLVETRISTRFTNITFGLCESLSGSQSFVCCTEKELVLHDCGVVSERAGVVVGYSFCVVVGGKVNMTRFSASGVVFGGGWLLSVRGSGTSGLVDGTVVSGTRSSTQEGIFAVREMGSLVMQNSRVEAVGECSSSAVWCGGGGSVRVESTSITGMTKVSGDGCGVHVERQAGKRNEVVIFNCTLRNCGAEMEKRGGGGVYGEVGETSQMSLEQCTFGGCTAPAMGKKGKGGGVYLVLESVGSEFAIKQPVFEDNRAEHGRNVFVMSPSLRESIVLERLPFFEAVGEEFDENEMEGVEEEEQSVVIPLGYYLLAPPVAVYVSESGADTTACGFRSYMCRRVGYSLGRIVGKQKVVEVVSGVSVDEDLVLDSVDGYVVRGSVKGVGMKMVGDGSGGSGMVEVLGVVEMRKLEFVLEETLNGMKEGVFLIGFITASGLFEECKAVCDENVDHCQFGLFVVEKGSLTVVEMEICSVVFSMFGGVVVGSGGCAEVRGMKASMVGGEGAKEMFECLEKGELKMRNCSVSGWSSTVCGVVGDRHGKLVEVKNSSFSGVAIEGGDGGVVSMAVGDGEVAVVSEVKIEGSKTRRGNGGGMWVEVSGSGSLSVGSTETEAETVMGMCEAEKGDGEGGYGGGMYLECVNGGSEFSVFGVRFEEGEKKNHGVSGGDNVYVMGGDLVKLVRREKMDLEMPGEEGRLGEFEGYDVERSMTVPLAVFVGEWMAPVYVGGESGVDYPLCGYEWYPCSTIGFAGEVRSVQGKADVVLQESFVFLERMVLAGEGEMEINGGEGKREIIVEKDGREAGDELIEVKMGVEVSRVVFCVPSRFECERKSLFVCKEKELALRECGMKMRVSGEKCMYSFVVVIGGKVNVEKLSVENVEFEGKGMMEFDGEGACGVIEGMELEGVKTVGASGLIVGRKAEEVVIGNSSVVGGEQEDSSVVVVEEKCSLKMRNVSVRQMKRQMGNGGMMVWKVGNGKVVDMKDCTLTEGSTGRGIRGGGCYVEVFAGGTLLCQESTVSWCLAPSESGFGGGMYVWFRSVEMKYGMKDMGFSENSASAGRDVFVVCAEPRVVLNVQYWSGTTREEEEEEARKRLWVVDGEPAADVSQSIFVYLYPSLDEVVFVEAGGRSDDMCGFSETPCDTVERGFGRMGETKFVLQVKSEATLNGSINRHGKSLTIRGSNTKGVMNVGRMGHVEVVEGGEQASLVLSKLVVKLPAESEKEEFVEMSVGVVMIVDCKFDGEESEEGSGSSVASVWVGSVKGGEMQIERVTVRGIEFCGGGIVRVGDGRVELGFVTVEDVKTNGEGMIVGENGSEMEMSGITMERCEMGMGSGVVVKLGKRCRVENNSMFTGCVSEEGDGGGLKCEVAEGGVVVIENSTFEGCEARGSEGKGGGMYMSVVGESREDCFAVKGCVFERNRAVEGADMFVVCEDLNATILPKRFEMELVGEDEVSKVELRGRDNGRFARESVDLLLFLVKFSGDEVHVSEGSGMDVLGCGKEEIACETLWCGIGHLKEESEQEEQKVVVSDRCVVSDCFVFERGTMICGPEAEEAKQAKMRVEWELKSDGCEAVMWSCERLSVRIFVISLPQVFGSGQSMVLGTEGGVVNVSNVGFEWRESGVVGYRIVSTLKGMLNVQNCSVREASFEKVPFAVHSSVVVESLEADGIASEGSRAGGVMEIELSGEEKAVLRSTNARGCKCSVSEGRGGFVHVNGSEARSASLLTLRGVVFEGNEAWKGKNVYLECADLNGSVNEETFVFEFGEMEKDSNLFVGSDGIHKDTDLFRFLVGYENWMVHVSWSGHDVKRCGSEADPCHTFWKGMGQVEAGQGKRKMVIGEKSEIRDGYKVRDFEVVSFGGSDEKRVKSEMVFGMGAGGKCGHLEGDGNLELSHLAVSAMAGFVNEEGALITGRSGMLMMKDCKLSWDGDRDSVMEVSFVQAVRGQMVLEDVRADSVSAGKSMIVASHEVSVQVRGMRVSSCNISSGSVIEVVASSASTISRADLGVEAGGRKQQKERNSEERGLVVNRSEFEFVKGAGDGSRVVSYLDWMGKGVELVDCVFTGCEGAGNEKGGAIFVEVGAEGWYELRECRVEKCGCSTEKGRGGGMYVRTDGAGKLGMLIAPKKFEANTAFAGRDVFVECDNLRRQINETHFRMSFDEDVFVRQNAILGIDRSEQSREPMDLLDLILVYQADTIIVSSAEGRNGEDKRQCGVVEQPCLSVGYGLMHVSHKVESRLIVDGKSVMDREMEFEEVSVLSRGRAAAEVAVAGQIEGERRSVVECRGAVEIRLLAFRFAEVMEGGHCVLFGCTEGSVSLEGCEFSPVEGADASAVHLTLIEASGAEVYISDVKVAKLEVECVCEVEGVGVSGNVVFERLKVEEVKVGRRAMGLSWQAGGRQGETGSCEVLLCSLGNVSFGDEEGRIAEIDVGGCLVEVFNSSFVNEWKGKRQGELALFGHCTDMKIVSCLFCGGKGSEENGCEEEEKVLFGLSEVCKWNGSVVELEGSAGVMRDTRVEKSGAGGLLVDGGKVRVEKGEFVENKVHIAGYESVRRNVRCSGGGEVDLRSLKGGDGAKENSSLWILEEGCSLLGIAAERASPLFIPELEEVEMKEEGESMHLITKGELLLPCNLSLKVIFRRGDEEATEGYEFDEEGFVWENEAHARIPLVKVTEADEEIEISCFVKFGSATAPSYTRSVVLKNRSEPKVNGDEMVVEGGKEGKSYWLLIVGIVIVVILLVIVVVLVVRWKKIKNEAEDLREIVNDNIKKDPKAFEMVTMEMSPEEQWRRAENEAEKKNEERMKKRVYEKSLGHSESSEHLLSESGSTEYILGKDSDKIPQWMLEKDEEEEIRKRTPSPSISSTSTTDSDSTFVQREDLCPTTSSMSNLVDAMACSSPHEKLIVDLRDSLFMLLHGRNEKKEMAIGTLKEREQTAAQILFWVANGALHSFDEMENPLQSLNNLSPHIVLFSEHMVICIAMHSDCSSDSDTSSSISSSTVVTSASDDESDSLPSSAFEDDEDNRKECLRWKAPELLNGTKKHATKKTVVFSIGMMLWECLTLQIPFGDYEAETAGEKIKNGERPNMGVIETSSFGETTKACVMLQAKSRPTLVELKREFFGHFPAEMVVVTASDAIDDENVSDVGRGSDIGSSSFSDTSFL
eukprot:MONOS_1012.1-p1 / transcript=MONOS_1012.1 / gene=MONOS_1012 / organism=Monocercomonoides_exilis_PA203 / gene_product=unspecified product / transcript_product=unspecified product / location=Mono_scaffold00017:27600-40293(-) / protein_length=4103 / sequence_SO=supercontig / SO=protein_coding / is_pseudo=false